MLNIKDIKIKDIEINIENPRKHSNKQVFQIAESIKEFGFTNPLLVDEKNFLIAGHGRLMAAKTLILETVPCIIVEGLTEEQKKALNIADNKLAINSTWDEELLWKQIKELTDTDYNIDLIGFDKEQVMPFIEDDRVVESILNEWEGMPEYNQSDKTSVRSVIVHFASEEECDNFFELLQQNHTDKTKSIWYPEQINMDTESKRYD